MTSIPTGGLEGAATLVTGGGSGIGLGCALRFARDGAPRHHLRPLGGAPARRGRAAPGRGRRRRDRRPRGRRRHRRGRRSRPRSPPRPEPTGGLDGVVACAGGSETLGPITHDGHRRVAAHHRPEHHGHDAHHQARRRGRWRAPGGARSSGSRRSRARTCTRWFGAYGPGKAGIDHVCQLAADRARRQRRPRELDPARARRHRSRRLHHRRRRGARRLPRVHADRGVGTVEDIAAMARFLVGSGVDLAHRAGDQRRRRPLAHPRPELPRHPRAALRRRRPPRHRRLHAFRSRTRVRQRRTVGIRRRYSRSGTRDARRAAGEPGQRSGGRSPERQDLAAGTARSVPSGAHTSPSSSRNPPAATVVRNEASTNASAARPGCGSSARKWIVRSTVGTNTGSSTRLNVGGIQASVIAAATNGVDLVTLGQSDPPAGHRTRTTRRARHRRVADRPPRLPPVRDRRRLRRDRPRHVVLRAGYLRHHEVAELDARRAARRTRPSASAMSLPSCSTRAEHVVIDRPTRSRLVAILTSPDPAGFA